MASPEGEGEILFEIVRLGAYAKVSALDAHSGTEISIVGPADADAASLKAAALRKLDFVLKKKNGGR